MKPLMFLLVVALPLGMCEAQAQAKMFITKHYSDSSSTHYLGYKLIDDVSDTTKIFGRPDKIEYWTPEKLTYTYLSKTDSTTLTVIVNYEKAKKQFLFHRTIEVVRTGTAVVDSNWYRGFQKIR